MLKSHTFLKQKSDYTKTLDTTTYPADTTGKMSELELTRQDILEAVMSHISRINELRHPQITANRILEVLLSNFLVGNKSVFEFNRLFQR